MTSQRSFVPTEGERLLLVAVFGEGARAVEAWQRWRQLRDLDRLDQSEFRLLPLLVRHSHAICSGDPLAGRLRGIHRRVWLDSQLRLRATAPVLRALESRGVPALLIKGAGLGVQAYRDLGSRPMADVDVLVPERDMPAAVAAARELGFRDCRSSDPAEHLLQKHAVALLRADDPHAHIDLHCRPMYLLTPPAFDRGIVERAGPIEAAGARARVPSPGDHLLIIACHGLRPNAVGPVRWAADAAMLIRSCAESIDWDRLLADARRCRLDWTLGEALRFVAQELDTAVPAWVLSRLARTRLSWTERLERPRRLRAHVLGADVAGLVAPWLRLRVRGSDAVRFIPLLALLTPLRAVWFAWKHAVLRPSRSWPGDRPPR
jgi:hypothetical protein